MKGLREMFGSGKRVFAGKQRLRNEPFCPFVTNDTGYQELRRSRSNVPCSPNGLASTGSFGPVQDLRQKKPANRQWW